MHQSHMLPAASDAWRRVQQQIAWMARSDLPLVLLGPTGSGKSFLAGEIHRLSGRSGDPVQYTIGAVPDALEASHLMGYRRGAFTGALHDHAGALERANNGTLFLDEIGLASRGTQGLLLGLMEGRPFTPIGASRPVTVDVRMLFATNVDPRQQLASGAWMPDFYYRLGGNFIVLPGLAERRGDILPMARSFLSRYLKRCQRQCEAAFSHQVEEVLLHHPWPGNIRQLEALCHRIAVCMADGKPVQLSDLSDDFLRDVGCPVGGQDILLLRIKEALRKNGGNQSAAARDLGIQRNKLLRLIRRYNISDASSLPFSRSA